MKEIRLCWVAVRTTGPFREPIEYGKWCPDTEAARRELQHIVDTGIKVWGEGSHWIQERDMVPLLNPLAKAA